MKPCGGRLAYEGVGWYRERADGRQVYHWVCEKCGEGGSGDGSEVTHGVRERRKRVEFACVVCMERPRVGALFCAACARSWDRDAEKDTTIAAAVTWAARRTRWFERRRVRRAVLGKLEVAVATSVKQLGPGMLERLPEHRGLLLALRLLREVL